MWFLCNIISVLVTVNGFDKVKTKLRFDGAMHYVYWQLKDHVIEGFNHLARSKLAQIPALLRRTASRVLSRHNTKIGTFSDKLLYFLRFTLRFH